jgi:hypothetical protein
MNPGMKARFEKRRYARWVRRAMVLLKRRRGHHRIWEKRAEYRALIGAALMRLGDM